MIAVAAPITGSKQWMLTAVCCRLSRMLARLKLGAFQAQGHAQAHRSDADEMRQSHKHSKPPRKAHILKVVDVVDNAKTCGALECRGV